MNVLTLGTFDLFHAGHVALLGRCRALAGSGTVTVGLNTDAFIEAYKGRPPVIGYAHRQAVLLACRYVDAVVPNDQTDGTAREAIEAAAPDIIVIGSDWANRDYLAQIGVSHEWLGDHGITIRYLPYTRGISTTAIRGRL